MRIELLGSAFTIQSDEDPSYLREVVDYFSRKVEEVSTSVSSADPLKISILAGILAADDYLKASRGTQDSEVARIARELIARLDETLEEEDDKA